MLALGCIPVGGRCVLFTSGLPVSFGFVAFCLLFVLCRMPVSVPSSASLICSSSDVIANGSSCGLVFLVSGCVGGGVTGGVLGTMSNPGFLF